jgi:primosomal protein N' (replication factor Y) (superfamily II helicase)
MPLFAQVVAKSNLIQLDRVFDFVVPDSLSPKIQFGQLVSFPFGRTKKLQQGFVVGLSETSDYATTELESIVSDTPVLLPEIYKLARSVADRQCVALGEILGAAIPENMARAVLEEPPLLGKPEQSPLPFEVKPNLTKKAAVLTAGKSFVSGDEQWADWAHLMLASASRQLALGKSAILIVPDQKDIDELAGLAEHLGLLPWVVSYLPAQKKSDRFRAFHKALGMPQSLVIGTRSAIYAPAKSLGLMAIYDDLDDSLREQGSPFTQARELALMRAGNDVEILMLAPYRSVEVQRLVEIGFLSDHEIPAPPARISYTEPGVRFDEGAFKLVRERLDSGPVLVLLPRKGNSAALYCQGCGDRLRCSCGGMIWEPSENRAICRICNKPHVKCEKCQSISFRRGRTGSTRTVSELGRVFPKVAIAEATSEKRPSGLKPKNQIVVATPGSAPKVKGGYGALLILDCDIWLSRQSLAAEQVAFRDWTGALGLLAPDGRAVLSGVDGEIGKAFAMQQHRQLARAQLSELRSLGLPPAVRIASVECAPEQMEQVLSTAKSHKAKVLNVDAGSSKILISFSYQDAPELAKSLRALALKSSARVQGGTKRRGLRVVMDDPDAL